MVLHLLLRGKTAHQTHGILQIGRNTSETAASSHNHDVLLVLLLQDFLLLDDAQVRLAEGHGVRTLDVHLHILGPRELGQTVGPAVGLAGDANLEVEVVTLVVGDGHGVVFEVAGLGHVDVRHGTHQVSVLALEAGADSDIQEHSALVSLNHRSAGVRVDGVPASQLIENVQDNGDVGIEDDVGAVEDHEVDEGDQHHHVEVVEDLPVIAADPRDGHEEGEEDDGHDLHQPVRGNHKAEIQEVHVLPGVLSVTEYPLTYILPRVVNDLVTEELPEVLLVLSVPVAERGEHVHEGHPEGERAEDTVSGNQDSLHIRTRERAYIGFTVDVLEDGVTGAESNLMNQKNK